MREYLTVQRLELRMAEYDPPYTGTVVHGTDLGQDLQAHIRYPGIFSGTVDLDPDQIPVGTVHVQFVLFQHPRGKSLVLSVGRTAAARTRFASRHSTPFMNSAAARGSVPSVTLPERSRRTARDSTIFVRDPLRPTEKVPRPRSILPSFFISYEETSMNLCMDGRGLFTSPSWTETTDPSGLYAGSLAADRECYGASTAARP